MKIKEKSNILGMLLVLLALILTISSCSDWKEIEDLNPEQKDISEQNPELYAKYLLNLRKYRESEHTLVYAWFDNSQKTTFSRAHHIADLPDSIDVVGLIHPDHLAEWELKEMNAIRSDKGIKVIYTVDFGDFKEAYNLKLDRATDEEPVAKDFVGFLADSLEYALSLTAKYGYDGICIGYNGKSRTHMRPAELREYQENEIAFINIVKDWHKRNSGKEIVFEGKPQNLIDPSILNDCLSVLISGKASTNENEFTYKLLLAATENVPQDRLGMTVMAVDPNDPKKAIGYLIGGKTAISGLANWAVATHNGIGIKAVGIYNVSADYHVPGKDYYHTRHLISTVNPPVK